MYCDGDVDDRLNLSDEDIAEMIEGTEYEPKHSELCATRRGSDTATHKVKGKPKTTPRVKRCVKPA